MLLLLAADVGGADQTTPDPHRSYQAKRSQPVRVDVDFRVIVTAPQGTKVLRVWVPAPQDDLGQHVEPGAWSVFPSEVKPTFHREEVFGNRFAYFEIAGPQGAQIITHTFLATTWQLDWDVRPEMVLPVREWPAAFEPYRRSERAIVVDDRFRQLAGQLVEQTTGPADGLNRVMGWTRDNLAYDHSDTSLIASSVHALMKKRGDCSDYHGLCSSLGRALGVPTRVTYGLHLFPKNLPCHCKLEAYLHPHGWVSFDVSETQRFVKHIEATVSETERRRALTQAAVARLQRGFRDNTWLLMTKGTDYELAPPAAAGRVPLIATIYAEADGKALPPPDPADPTKHEFAWMTSHRYRPERPLVYPFREVSTLTLEKR